MALGSSTVHSSFPTRIALGVHVFPAYSRHSDTLDTRDAVLVELYMRYPPTPVGGTKIDTDSGGLLSHFV